MSQLQQPGSKLIGHEYVSPDEDAVIAEMIEELKNQVLTKYRDREMLRQIHTKMHGCVQAEFRVMDEIPADLKVGVFKKARSFSSLIRFSNSNSDPQPDRKKDIRGFAIKLMNVPGEKLLNDERFADTQDFLLMSSPTFFARNLMEFRGLLKAVSTGNKFGVAAYFLNPMHWGVLARLVKSNIKCLHPLAISYWSTQPYQFGDQSRAVKYMVKPSAANQLLYADTNQDNFLRSNLAKTLLTNSIDFDFFIQLQTDAEKMPIEDPTVEWKAPFIKVAQIHIPVQDFDTEAQNNYGENLSFNPWHSLPEHRPLGSFNRARKRVYEELTALRHEQNKVELFEPSVESFAAK